jgi:hypothetical protein
MQTCINKPLIYTNPMYITTHQNGCLRYSVAGINALIPSKTKHNETINTPYFTKPYLMISLKLYSLNHVFSKTLLWSIKPIIGLLDVNIFCHSKFILGPITLIHTYIRFYYYWCGSSFQIYLMVMWNWKWKFCGSLLNWGLLFGRWQYVFGF